MTVTLAVVAVLVWLVAAAATFAYRRRVTRELDRIRQVLERIEHRNDL